MNFRIKPLRILNPREIKQNIKIALAQNALADTALTAKIVMDVKKGNRNLYQRYQRAESNGIAQYGRT